MAIGDAALQAHTRSGMPPVLKAIVGVVLVGGVGLGGWLAWDYFDGKGHDEPYEPQHPVNLQEVDLAALHHRDLTRWALTIEMPERLSRPELQAAAALQQVQQLIEPDGNLTDLFEELRGLVEEHDLRKKSKRDRALYLTRAWNQYLDANDAPYFLRAFVVADPNPEFQLYAYEVVAEAKGRIDGDEERVRLLSRIDEVNRGEWYHASTPSEGAVVRIDWSNQLALDEVWPLFGEPDPKYQRRKLFGPAVVAEAEAALSASTVEVLRRTADARAAAVRAHDEIAERHGCSGFSVGRLPWDGYDGDVLENLLNHVGPGRCPAVRNGEYKALDEARNRLSEAEGLEEALQELVAWVARDRMAHELAHVAIGVDIYDERTSLPCSICAKDLKNSNRAEVVALVAEWAASTAPALTLFRRCFVDDELAAGSLDVAFRAIDHSCAEGPKSDLAEAARALMDESLGGVIELEVDGAVSKPLPLDRSVVHMREAEL